MITDIAPVAYAAWAAAEAPGVPGLTWDTLSQREQELVASDVEGVLLGEEKCHTVLPIPQCSPTGSRVFVAVVRAMVAHDPLTRASQGETVPTRAA